MRIIVEEKKLIPLKFDLMFKKVFGDNENKEPLRILLKCILDIEPKEIIILNSEILGSSYYDKRTTVDLIVELDDGTKIGIEDKKLAKNITKGDKSMEEILDKVEDFSDDEEIIGAYDGQWHRQEVARVVMLSKIEEAEEQGIQRGIQRGSLNKSIEIAINMLKENVDIEFISKVTGLSINQIKELESK